ncbi:uncharacterized protein LOC124292501 isoform X2 [Haliotis rubra]|uniref:uncharacterized protein LOC124292501 isoform X2 n=1 Tax=Haliotis rubra TaxID=36100 RepID=UPI001EE51FB2|nr:uncharacterized protein LOC124292501 isoform X2 [Haliotis rubra]
MKLLPLLLLLLLVLVCLDASNGKWRGRRSWRRITRRMNRSRWITSTTKLHGRDLESEDIKQGRDIDQSRDEVLFNARDVKVLMTSADNNMMKVILVAALLVCLLAIHTDAIYSYRHYRNYRIRMYWSRTTSCIYRAARRLSRCYGVRSRFQYYHGKRGIENADENADENTEQPENDDLISARDVMETVMDEQGGNAGSKSGLRQLTEA